MQSQADPTARMIAGLRAAGVRVTSQRRTLLDLLADASDHPDAAALHRRAQASDATISLATIGRTLTMLKRAGVLRRHGFDGDRARLESADEPHRDHSVDRDTGRIVEARSDTIERLQRQIAAELGYEVVHHRLELSRRPVERSRRTEHGGGGDGAHDPSGGPGRRSAGAGAAGPVGAGPGRSGPVGAGRGRSGAEAVRTIAATPSARCRWRQALGGLTIDQVRRLRAPEKDRAIAAPSVRARWRGSGSGRRPRTGRWRR